MTAEAHGQVKSSPSHELPRRHRRSRAAVVRSVLRQRSPPASPAAGEASRHAHQAALRKRPLTYLERCAGSTWSAPLRSKNWHSGANIADLTWDPKPNRYDRPHRLRQAGATLTRHLDVRSSAPRRQLLERVLPRSGKREPEAFVWDTAWSNTATLQHVTYVFFRSAQATTKSPRTASFGITVRS